MKKKSITRFWCTILVSTALLTSCDPGINLDELSDEIQIDQSLVVPIGDANITIEEFLAQLDLTELNSIHPDSIYYETEVNKSYRFSNEDMLKNVIPFSKTFNVNIAPLPQVQVPGGQEIPIPGDIYMDLGLEPSQRFDSVKIATALLGFSISVTNLAINPSDLIITLDFPDMMNESDRAVINNRLVPITSFGSSTDVALSNFILTNKDINNDWVKIAGLNMKISMKLRPGASPVTVYSNSKIKVDINFKKLDYKVAYGKFDLSTIGVTTLKVPLDMMESLPKGLRFEDPRASINIVSNIGSKVRFDINYVKAFSKTNPSEISWATFDGGSHSTSETIDRVPAVYGDTIHYKMRTLNKNYGGTGALFGSGLTLDTLEYKFSLNTVEGTQPSFIIPNMKISANIKVQIPLQLQAGSSIEFKDTLEDVGSSIAKLKQGTLVLGVTNGLPVQVVYKMSFQNAAGAIIPSSINTKEFIIDAPIVNADGSVNKEQTFNAQNISIELTKEQIAELQDAKNLVYTINLLGKDATKLICFTKSNFIKVKLGLYVTADETLGTSNN